MTRPRRLRRWLLLVLPLLAGAGAPPSLSAQDGGAPSGGGAADAGRERLEAAEAHLAARDAAAARRAGREALALFVDAGATDEEATTLNVLGNTFQAAGVADSALHYYRRAYDRAHEVGHDRTIGNAALNLSQRFNQEGRPDSVLAYLRVAHRGFERAGVSDGVAFTAAILSGGFGAAGQADSALAYGRRAASLADSVEDPGIRARGLDAYARARLAAGDAEGALATLRRVEDEQVALGGPFPQTDLLAAQAYVELQLADSAVAAGRRAMERAARANLGMIEAEAALLLVDAHGPGDAEAAARSAEIAVSRFREVGHPHGVARALVPLALLVGPQRPDSAGVLLREAVEIFREVGDASGEARALSSLALSLRSDGRAEPAIRYAREAVEAARRSGSAGMLASTLQELGRAVAVRPEGAEEGREALLESLELRRGLGDRSGAAAVLFDLGRIAASPTEARERFEAAGEEARAAGDPEWASFALIELSHTYEEEDPARRLQLLRAASEASAGAAPYARAATLISTANALHQAGEPDSARAYFERAMEVVEQVGSAGQQLGAQVVFARFMAQREIPPGLAARIADMVGRLEDLEEGYGTQVRSSVGSALSMLAEQAMQAGELDSATVVYRRQFEFGRSAGDDVVAAGALAGLARIQRTVGRPDSAAALARAAAEGYARAGAVDLARSAILMAGQLDGTSGDVLAFARDYLARTEGQIGGTIAARVLLAEHWLAASRPDSARVHLLAAEELAARMGDGMTHAQVLLQLARLHVLDGDHEDAIRRAAHAVRLSRRLGSRTHEGIGLGIQGGGWLALGDLETATAYFDSASVVLAGVRRDAGDEAARMTFADEVAFIIDGWVGTEAEDGRLVQAVAAHERGRSQELLELIDGVRILEPGADLYDEGAALLEPVLESGAVVLSYWLPKAGDMVGVTVVDPDTWEPRFVQVEVPRDTLLGLILDFREHVTGESTEPERSVFSDLDVDGRARGLEVPAGGDEVDGEAVRRALARLLLPEPVREVLEATSAAEIVIVPGGALNLVPFAALPLGERALGERFGIRYTPSLTILAEVEGRRAVPPDAFGSGALVIGDPEMPGLLVGGRRETLSPLPAARREGEWLAGRLGAPLLTGGAATETEVRSRLPRALLVHLATHGFSYSSERRERDSFVALAPDGENDGLLTVGDVLSQEDDLSAELVVLSACRTGLGNVRAAEGTVGLQRAFLARGARSLLVSLWSVSDEATGLLMRRFYEHWLAGDISKAEALRRAQTDVRETEGFEDPRYWAAFQLVGAR